LNTIKSTKIEADTDVTRPLNFILIQSSWLWKEKTN